MRLPFKLPRAAPRPRHSPPSREVSSVQTKSPSDRPDTRHIVRLVIIAAGLVTSVLMFRLLFPPESFGRFGHYRADALQDIRKRDVAYIGSEACADCHDE